MIVKRDRDGSVIEDEPQGGEHACVNGWLQEESWDGKPQPCPVCKPHLAKDRDRLRTKLEGPDGVR